MKSFWLKYTATWFGSGLSPKAPGTAGSLATLPFVYALALVGGWQAVLAFALAVSVLGVFAADAYARQLGKEDPGCIVIDETAGQALTLLAAGTDWRLYVVGFALFRLLDITKPGPIGWADRRLHGGLGIMADDIIAGIIGALILWGIKIYIF